MINSKIIRILSTFSKDELKSFERFTKSPFFKTRRNTEGLFHVLSKYHPHFTEADIDKKKIFGELFGETEKFNEKKLKNLIIELSAQADEFLIISRTRSDTAANERLIASEYRERKLDKYYLNTVRFIEKKISAKNFNSFDCFTPQQEYEKLMQEYFVGKNDWEKAVASKTMYAEYFIMTIVIRYLRTLREKLIAQSAYNTPYGNEVLEAMRNSFDIEKMIDTLKSSGYRYSYLLQIYYHAYKSIESDDGSESYNKLKELVLEHLDEFAHQEKYALFSDMVTYCIEKDKSGKGATLSEEFSLYSEMKKHNVLSWSGDDYIQIVTFRNIMITCITLKEFGWLERFTIEYEHKIAPEYRENMKNLIMANIRHSEGRFEEALSHISKVKYDVFLYKVDVRNLILKIYYELNLFEQAFYAIDSYRHFLNSTNEFSDFYQQQNMNYINFLSRLLRAKADGNIKDIDLLENEINSADYVSSKNWLLAKVKELEAI